MADVVNTISELENVFWTFTTQALGFDPEDDEDQDKVRIAWPTDGQPGFEIDKDYAFLKVVEIDSPINRLRNVSFPQKDADNATQKSEYTRVIQVLWTFYGANGFDRADLIRHSVFLDEYKSYLKSNSLYLITDIEAPVRIPEQFQGQWWERTDLVITFNEYVKRENTVPYLQSAEITILTDTGTERIVEINNPEDT